MRNRTPLIDAYLGLLEETILPDYTPIRFETVEHRDFQTASPQLEQKNKKNKASNDIRSVPKNQFLTQLWNSIIRNGTTLSQKKRRYGNWPQTCIKNHSANTKLQMFDQQYWHSRSSMKILLYHGKHLITCCNISYLQLTLSCPVSRISFYLLGRMRYTDEQAEGRGGFTSAWNGRPPRQVQKTVGGVHCIWCMQTTILWLQQFTILSYSSVMSLTNMNLI